MGVPVRKLKNQNKALLIDNQKLTEELFNLFARNAELVILLEQQNELITKTNKQIEEINNEN